MKNRICLKLVIIIILCIVIFLSIYLINNVLLMHNDMIKIEAASTFYPFATNLVQEIYKEEGYLKNELKMVSTSQAYSDIINYKTDIIISTVPSDEQMEEIQKSDTSLVFKPIYLETLVIFVNRDNKIDNLNIEQIQQMYYNNTSWNEYGGEEARVHTYQLEKNNGSQTCFETIVKNNKLGETHFEIKTMPEIIDDVGNDKYGIGYAFNSYYSKMHINRNTKIIKINNKSNKDDYPLLFEVYMIYRKDNNNDKINKIVEWIENDEGKRFINKIKD